MSKNLKLVEASPSHNHEPQCTICKFYDSEENHSASDLEMVFDETGNCIKVKLCRSHAVELFRMGQKKFFLNHYGIAQNVVGYDEDKLLSLMLRTAHRFS